LEAARRLLHQHLVRPRFETPAGLVRWMGAVQAQDPLGSLWAVGQRVKGAVEADVEAAIADGSIVRTWPMRGTLHYVPAADARWMLRLLAPRVIARSAGRYRELGLGAADFARSRTVLVKALRGGRRLMRHDAYAVIERGGVSAAGQRGIHILGHLAQQGVLCLGPREGRQPTFVLLDEWVPPGNDLGREEGLAELAARYFASHGPATSQDFAWWAGLPVKDAQRAIDAAGPRARDDTHAAALSGPVALLLPPWDEYLVAYKDRTHACSLLRAGDPRLKMAIGNGLIVIDGRIRGAWKRTLAPSRVTVRLDFWTRVTAKERRAVENTAARYGRFLGREVEVR
jgi:hypothetical protein